MKDYSEDSEYLSFLERTVDTQNKEITDLTEALEEADALLHDALLTKHGSWFGETPREQHENIQLAWKNSNSRWRK